MTESTASGLLASSPGPELPARLAALIHRIPDDARAVVEALDADPARMQLPRRFEALVWRGGCTSIADHEVRLMLHNLAAHLLPAGRLLVPDHPLLTALAGPCGLLEREVVDEWSLFRRTTRVTIHDLVAEAREGSARFGARELASALGEDPTLVVLDTRTPTDRERTGVIPGSLHAPRTTVEWQCDPASGYSDPRITSFEQQLVTVCNEGYSSSLAAASLRRLGFVHATDLVGGVAAWVRAGLPVESPTHTHIS